MFTHVCAASAACRAACCVHVPLSCAVNVRKIPSAGWNSLWRLNSVFTRSRFISADLRVMHIIFSSFSSYLCSRSCLIFYPRLTWTLLSDWFRADWLKVSCVFCKFGNTEGFSVLFKKWKSYSFAHRSHRWTFFSYSQWNQTEADVSTDGGGSFRQSKKYWSDYCSNNKYCIFAT